MYRVMPEKDVLPFALYRAEQVRKLDQLAIEQYHISAQTLMQKAGDVAFDRMRKQYPEAKRILIYAGTGNNGGDAWVVAINCLQQGLQPRVIQIGDSLKFSQHTLYFFQKYQQLGGIWQHSITHVQPHDLVIDGLLGTGLTQIVRPPYSDAIAQINQHQSPVISLDIPSGINSDTGAVAGIAVYADVTMSFIGLKQGMYTAAGQDYCGKIFFHALDLPAKVYASEILSARRFDASRLPFMIQPRRHASHKGSYGHVAIVGGNCGYSGAVLLAANAALRSGAGRVTVITHRQHHGRIIAHQPALMTCDAEDQAACTKIMLNADAVVVGPGLGLDDWARKLFEQVMEANRPTVIDADGLTLLAEKKRTVTNAILTPHPGEASRLIGKEIDIQSNRFSVVKQLVERYQSAIILKGNGSLIDCYRSNKPVAVIDAGNPGMATAGSGDVLSGIAGTLLAQSYNTDEAALIAALIHSVAGDLAAQKGQIGMVAGDIINSIRQVMNTND